MIRRHEILSWIIFWFFALVLAGGALAALSPLFIGFVGIAKGLF